MKSNSTLARLATVVAAVALLLAGAATPAAATDPAEDLNLGPEVIKTDVGPTGYSVTFRYQAPPEMTNVRIWGEWNFTNPATFAASGPDGRFGADWQAGDAIVPAREGFLLSPMTKGEDGVWSFTTPLPAGTFSYHFVHDDCPGPSNANCVRQVDPANPGPLQYLTPTGGQTFNQVYVPANPLFPTYDYSMQAPTTPERTGTFEHVQYTSPASTTPVGTHYAVVYLPAGYDENRETPYPTLYLSHGLGGNEAHWSQQGLSNTISENLTAEGLAQSMVIVSTNFNGLNGDTGYAQDMIDNLIPFIEGQYNVSSLPEDRAFGGQSLGGARGTALLFNYTPTFEYYGLWASASSATPNPTQVAAIKQVRGGIHIGSGLQDSLATGSTNRVVFLRGQGVTNVTEFNVNGGHTWDAARPLIESFIRSVAFRSTETALVAEARGGVAGITATVSPLGTSQAAVTGSVEFLHGETVIGTAEVQADGTAHIPLEREAGTVVARYLGDALFNASQVTLALPLNITATVSTRCIAGKAVLTVNATNPNDVPVNVSFESAYGTKAFVNVAPGKSVLHGFTTRLAALQQGRVTVTAVGGDASKVLTVPSAAATCN